MRRIAILSAVLFSATLGAEPQSSSQAPTQPPPVFRGGTNLVQVDAIVADSNGQPIVDLGVDDFEVRDDGKPVTIDRVRFLGADAYSGDPVLAPIRTHDDEEREASRDDVRLYAILLDDYHVRRMEEQRVIEPLLAFVRAIPPTDLVAVYYPLDSVTDVAFTRDRELVEKQIHTFYGRKGDYTPKRPVEEEHLRNPLHIEEIRQQIVMSSLEGLAVHLGGIKQGRKSLIFVTDGFVMPQFDVQDIYQAANRANVAFYPLDPQGLTIARDRGTTSSQIMSGVVGARDALRALALETGGRAIVEQNDFRKALGQVLRDSSAYYLIAYETPHPDDGKFHRVSVNVKRPRASVFARSGYWAYKRGENTITPTTPVPPMPAAVEAAVAKLADSLRPDADEPAEGRRRSVLPKAAEDTTPVLLSPPTIALARGREVGDPVARREFHRTDTLVVQASTTRTPTVSARLLDRRGQALADLPMMAGTGRAELRLQLGNLGPGDYVIELTGRAENEAAQQYVAFRVIR